MISPFNFVHYSGKPTLAVQSREQEVHPFNSPFQKPRGLWLSTEGDCGWRDYCCAISASRENLTHIHDVTLATNANLLVLDSQHEFELFTERYGKLEDVWAEFANINRFQNMARIEWERVAQAYQGIVIIPYRREYAGAFMWYSCWDCDSACIWDATAIHSITLREVVPVSFEVGQTHG